MECPYCGSELTYEDYYGKINEHGYLNRIGDIFTCPNREYFEDLDLAKEYRENNVGFKEIPLEEICCYSACFNGFFYTDRNEELHEGYPC